MAASTHLVVPSTTRNGARIQQLVDQTAQAVYLANQLAAIIATYGTDMTTLSADLGFTGATAVADCTTVVGLLSAGYTNGLQNASLLAMINKLG